MVRKKSKHTQTAVRMNDGVQSLYTSLGQKSAALTYSDKTISDAKLTKAYKQSWLVQKYINKTAHDMIKKEREFSGEYDDELLAIALKEEKRLDVKQVINEVLTNSALLGECLLVAITDEDDFISPLSSGEKIRRFICVTKSDYSVGQYNDDDLMSDNFGKPLWFSIRTSEGEKKIHHSRCYYAFLGKRSINSRNQRGTSDLQASFSNILLFDTIIQCIADIIQDSNVDVLFIPDLQQQIASGQENKLLEYVDLLQRTKSAQNMIILDAGTADAQGRWEQKTATYSGLSDVLDRMIKVLAGALDRPITVLFGQSASGFASGEEDNRAYYETINALQEARLRPIYQFIDNFIMNKFAPEIEYEFPSIDSINETEEATLFSNVAAAITQLVSAEIISDEVAQKELIARGVLKNTTMADFEELNIEEESNEDEADRAIETGGAFF